MQKILVKVIDLRKYFYLTNLEEEMRVLRVKKIIFKVKNRKTYIDYFYAVSQLHHSDRIKKWLINNNQPFSNK